jgi:replicative DNA helicase
MEQNQPERPLPNSAESERHLLGSIMGRPELIERARELKAEHFYVPSNAKIFTAILDLIEDGESIEPIAVKERVNHPSVPMSLLTGMISDAVYGMMGIDGDVARVLETSRQRWALQFGERVTAMAWDESAEETLEFAQAQIDQARKTVRRTATRALAEMVDDQARRYRLWHKGISNAIPTGFPDIDDRLLGGGLVRSGLYLLAARPSMGKTSLALDIAANIAKEKHSVHIVSREMPAESLFDRLHAAYAGIERWKLRAGIYAKDYNRLLETLEGVASLPITLDNASLSVSDIRRELKTAERRQRPVSVVVIDYLQMLKGRGRSRTEEVGSVSRDLKGLAMEFDIPVLALSQLSRDSSKQNREPELSDLRDSGELEQDADAAFFLFGDQPEEGSRMYSRWLKCAKQRDGALFRQELLFNGSLVTFRSVQQLAVSGIHDYTEATQ